MGLAREVDKELQGEAYRMMVRRGWVKVIHEVDMICMVHKKGGNKNKPLYAEIRNDGVIILLGAKQ